MRKLPERKPIWLQGWDYSRNATYFITICTKNKDPYFGEIRNGIMHLSEMGAIAHSEWLKSPNIRLDMNLELGTFVVMPDHMHAIITIGINQFNQRHGDYRRDAMHCDPTPPNKNKFGPQSKNLAAIIRGYKSAVTKRAHLMNPEFAWQARFYDHIVRNPYSAEKISQYIRDNVHEWANSKPKSLFPMEVTGEDC